MVMNNDSPFKFCGLRSFHPKANGSVTENIHDISLKKED